jgi:hypothetical protein
MMPTSGTHQQCAARGPSTLALWLSIQFQKHETKRYETRRRIILSAFVHEY